MPGEPKAGLGRVLSLASVQPVAPDMLVCLPRVLTEGVAQQTCFDLHQLPVSSVKQGSGTYLWIWQDASKSQYVGRLFINCKVLGMWL